VVWAVREQQAGVIPELIIKHHPALTSAAVSGALAFYHDHKDVLDRLIEEQDRLGARTPADPADTSWQRRLCELARPWIAGILTWRECLRPGLEHLPGSFSPDLRRRN
jgi:hypothetical protein